MSMPNLRPVAKYRRHQRVRFEHGGTTWNGVIIQVYTRFEHNYNKEIRLYVIAYEKGGQSTLQHVYERDVLKRYAYLNKNERLTHPNSYVRSLASLAR